MLQKWLFKVTAKLPCRLIKREDHPYLERYFVASALGRTIYLHRFVGTDPDEGVHNHPWNALAICLSGGYTEARLTGFCPMTGWVEKLRRIRPGSFNRIRANDFHQIVSMKPGTWTLFLHGPMKHGWGFLRRERCDYGLPTHSFRTVFHQPFELTNGSKWWKRAQTGRLAHRELLE